MSHRKPLIRRTFLQERYEILIKRQRAGKATFDELTELDEIVNRDPEIRKIVLIENHFIPGPDDNDPEQSSLPEITKPARQSWLSRIKTLIRNVFISEFTAIKTTAKVSV
jgi:hypothetical protein